MKNYRIISSDNHIVEPPDLWLDRISPKFKDRAPRVVKVDGGEIWVVDNVHGGSHTQGTQTGWRFDQPENLAIKRDAFENVRPGAYDPGEAIKDMEIDGIDAAVVYPSQGLLMYQWVPDSELLTDIFRAYNDFCAEYCNAYPKQLRGVTFLNVDDIPGAVKEMYRGKKMGMAGAAIPVFTERLRYNSPEYEPIWSAAEDLGMPITLHLLTLRPGPNRPFGEGATREWAFHITMCCDYWAKVSLADMILSGVFDRHPNLMVGSAEQELSWVPYFIQRMDFHYTQSRPGISGYRFKNDMLPSDVFRKNVFVDTQEDYTGIRLRNEIGIDNILWGSDYPHEESTFPKSQEFLDTMLADCTEEEKAKISGANTARIYGI